MPENLGGSSSADGATGAGGAIAVDGAGAGDTVVAIDGRVVADGGAATGGVVAAGGVSGSKGGASGATGGASGSTRGSGGAAAGANGSADGATGGNLGTGGAVNQSCSWLADCLGTNNCVDQECVTACASQASDTAIVQYTAILDCVDANPQCTTEACIAQACASEISACSAPSPVDAGPPEVPDAAVTRGDTSVGRDAAAVPDVIPTHDVDAVGSGGGEGYTTSGSCDVVSKIPGLVDSHTCWDYTMTVTTNHNDGTEHYVAYTTTDVAGTESACTSQSYSATQPGPWDSASISVSNLSHKKQACDIAGSSYGTTTTWTEGGSCSLTGSLGHCTDAVTNAWDPSTSVLSASLVGSWSVP